MQSSTGTTADDTVRGRRTTLLAVALIVCSAFVWWASEYDIAYYQIAPGSAVDTAPLIEVTDPANYHPAEGKVLLTTVLFGKVTLLEAIAGWLDPTVDVVRETTVAPPDVDEDELRELNLGVMEDSKQTALAVAFEALGVDAVSGSGAEIIQLFEGTPAADALEVGDTIVAVDGAATAVHIDAVAALGDKAPGDTVVLSVEPAGGGEARDVTVELIDHPEEPGRPLLGVSLATRDLVFDFPFEVDLRSNEIGGPSAGLAFTLEIIDVLTEGELTGGLTVASTGTIELDGSVGEVGGVAQKTTAVNEADADLFLVPIGELELARRYADDDVEVVGVATLDDALAALAEAGGNGLALPAIEADTDPT